MMDFTCELCGNSLTPISSYTGTDNSISDELLRTVCRDTIATLNDDVDGFILDIVDFQDEFEILHKSIDEKDKYIYNERNNQSK